MILKQTSQFKKDLKRYKHSVDLLEELKIVLRELQNQGKVPDVYLPHPLHGDYKDCMECHVLDDFLLIWIDKTKPIIKILRLGSHSELYGKGRRTRQTLWTGVCHANPKPSTHDTYTQKK